MTPARHAQAMQSLNSMAKKVLEAVPIAAYWPTNLIVAELNRLGRSPELNVVQACLHTLRDQSLVTIDSVGNWQRIVPRARTVASVEAPKAVPSLPQPEPTTLDKLADLSKGLRTISRQLNEAAELLDDATLEMEQRIQQSQAESEEFRQLKALLKKFGT